MSKVIFIIHTLITSAVISRFVCKLCELTYVQQHLTWYEYPKKKKTYFHEKFCSGNRWCKTKSNFMHWRISVLKYIDTVNPITNYVHIDMINTIISLTITLMSSMSYVWLYFIFKNKHLIRKAVVLLALQFDFDNDDDT